MEQLNNHFSNRGFSTAGLPYNSKSSPLLHGKGHAVYSTYKFMFCEEFSLFPHFYGVVHLRIFKLQQRIIHVRPPIENLQRVAAGLLFPVHMDAPYQMAGLSLDNIRDPVITCRCVMFTAGTKPATLWIIIGTRDAALDII